MNSHSRTNTATYITHLNGVNLRTTIDLITGENRLATRAAVHPARLVVERKAVPLPPLSSQRVRLHAAINALILIGWNSAKTPKATQ